VDLTAIWFNFDELKEGELHDEHPAATWKLRAISGVKKTEQNQENLCRNGRSQ
jgi:hypothetical protein